MKISSDIVKKLKENVAFQVYSDYVVESIMDLRVAKNISPDQADELIGQQVRANYTASEKLIEILAPFVDFSEKQGPTKEQLAKAKEKYGL